MSTRSVIARPHGRGFAGVYHHNDGYPRGVGRIVWNLMARRYNFDAAAFWAEIIDQNLDGWSALHCFHPEWGACAPADWDGTTKITVDESMQIHREARVGERPAKATLPVSYKGDSCRGDPTLRQPPFTDTNIGDDIEWVYLVEAEGLRVFRVLAGTKVTGSRPHMERRPRLIEVGFCPWLSEEPSWEAIGDGYTSSAKSASV